MLRLFISEDTFILCMLVLHVQDPHATVNLGRFFALYEGRNTVLYTIAYIALKAPGNCPLQQDWRSRQ